MQLELPLLLGLKLLQQSKDEDLKMAEQEKDNTLTVVIAVTLIAIIGVFLLKQDETKHHKSSADTTASAEAQVLKAHKDFNNDVLSQAK